MGTLGSEVGHGDGEQSDTRGKKVFSNKPFWGVSHRDKVLEFACYMDFYKTSSACCNTASCLRKDKWLQQNELFSIRGKKELTQNSQGFLFNYLLKGLQRRVLFQACCQKELCERLECLPGMAHYSSGGASVVHGSCCAALGSLHPLGIYRQLLWMLGFVWTPVKHTARVLVGVALCFRCSF